MSTSDERLKIAKRLRLAKGQSELVSAIGIDAYGARWTWNGVSNRIANLVDPTCKNKYRDHGDRSFLCSECGYEAWTYDDSFCDPDEFRFCPCCGARVASGDD